MRFSAIMKMLTNNGRFKPGDADYRRAFLLNIFFLIFCLANLLFATYNFLMAKYIESATVFISAVFSLCGMFFFHRTGKLELSALAAVALFFATLVVVFTVMKSRCHSFVWACFFPLVAFMLLERKTACAITAIFISYLLSYILLSYKSWPPAEFTFGAIMNIMAAVTGTAVFMYSQMSSRQHYEQAIRDKNDELEEANRALRESRERLRLILNSTEEAILGLDAEAKCTFCNLSCIELLGYDSDSAIIGRDVYELIHSRRRDMTPIPREECRIVKTCREGVPAHVDDEVFWRADGTCFDVEYSCYPQYKDGKLVGAVVTFTDNTLKKQQEKQIEYFSSHDSLTGLLNRSTFEAMLRRVDTEKNLPISVIMGDLNGLKLSNDVFGHDAGDELLVRAAEIVRRACREGDIIARLGGDEFAILLPRTHHADALQIIARIRDMLHREKSNVIRCSMSLGCATKVSSDESINAILKNAENEMYKEKALSRSRVAADMLNAIIMTLYSKSPAEEQHSTNVSEMCRAIGEALGLPDTEIGQLRKAGFLHDIGKVAISEDAIKRHNELADEGDLDCRQHPVIGFRILNLFDNTVNLAESVLSHHEHWDGSGFPRGLKGSEIPLMARIIGAAGWLDNMLKRLGREELCADEVLVEIEKASGTILDPHIAGVLADIVRKSGRLL